MSMGIFEETSTELGLGGVADRTKTAMSVRSEGGSVNFIDQKLEYTPRRTPGCLQFGAPLKWNQTKDCSIRGVIGFLTRLTFDKYCIQVWYKSSAFSFCDSSILKLSWNFLCQGDLTLRSHCQRSQINRNWSAFLWFSPPPYEHAVSI